MPSSRHCDKMEGYFAGAEPTRGGEALWGAYPGGRSRDQFEHPHPRLAGMGVVR